MRRCGWRLLLVAVVILLAPWAALPPGDRAQARSALSHIRIAFTQNYNVYLMNADGSGRVTVTTRGSRTTGISYPWYQWSPDGKYLLLLREQLGKGGDLLLMDQEGNLLRTLATNLSIEGNTPRWAMDSDQIAYTSASMAEAGGLPQRRLTISRMDIYGRHVPLWTYVEYTGCDLDPTMTRLRTSGFFDPSWGAAVGELMPVFEWSVGRHQAIYSAGCKGLNFTDTQTGATRLLPEWTDIAVSQSGTVAAATSCGAFHQCIALVDPRSAAQIHLLTSGIEPLFSRSGSALYLVRQDPGPSLDIKQGDVEPYNDLTMTTASSAIWRINIDSSQLTRLAHEDAYAFTSMQLAPDGHSLVFSRTDNPWEIWKHRSSADHISFAMFYKYAPQVSIQSLDIVTGKVTTIVRDAGGPAVQPLTSFVGKNSAVSKAGSVSSGAGRIVYQANWSRGLGGWTQPGGSPPRTWYVVNGVLEGSGPNEVIDPPFSPGAHGIADYAVEAQFRKLSGSTSYGCSLRLVRAKSAAVFYGWAVYLTASGWYVNLYSATGVLASRPFDPGTDWHTYRIEARGARLRLLIDGRPMLSTTDGRYGAGGATELWNWNTLIAVRNFRIVAL